MTSTHVIPVNRAVMIERKMHIIECANCSIDFGIGEDFMARRRKDHQTFYCPNGHQNYYAGQTDEQKLREAAARETALRDQLAAATRAAERTRVALLRDRQRFVNGLCPCCGHSFGNVRSHMEAKHPDYDIRKVQHPDVVEFKCSCGFSSATHRGLRTHQGHMRTDGWDEPDQDPYWAHLTVVPS